MAKLPAGWILIPKTKDGVTVLFETRELVRCKDCKFYPNGEGTTKWVPCREIITAKNWFCADGKKRDDETTLRW